MDRSKGNLVRRNLKKSSIVIENVLNSEVLRCIEKSVHANIYSNSFSSCEVNQMKKELFLKCCLCPKSVADTTLKLAIYLVRGPDMPFKNLKLHGCWCLSSE